MIAGKRFTSMLLYSEFEGEYSYGVYFIDASSEYIVHLRYDGSGSLSGVYANKTGLSNNYNYLTTWWCTYFTTFRCDGSVGVLESYVSDFTAVYTNLGTPQDVFVVSPSLTNPKQSELSFVANDSIFNFYKLTDLNSYTAVANYNRLTITDRGVIRTTAASLDLVIYSETTGGTAPTFSASSSTYWRAGGTDIHATTSTPFITLSSIDSISNLDEFKEWFYSNFAFYGTLT